MPPVRGFDRRSAVEASGGWYDSGAYDPRRAENALAGWSCLGFAANSRFMRKMLILALPPVSKFHVPMICVPMIRASLISAVLAVVCGFPAQAAVQGGVSGVFADYLVGHVAAAMGDYDVAAQSFMAVLAHDPHNIHALNEGFEVLALSGGADTLRVAKMLPHNGLAMMEVANQALIAGQWDQAARDYAKLPNLGPFPLLRPVLQAWCDAGAGRNLAAIHELQQAANGSSLAGIYLLQAAFIADRAGRMADAAELYRVAQNQSSQVSLRFALAQASFLARSGQVNTARGMLTDLLAGVPQDSMALPRLLAGVSKPLVATPRDGVAEFLLAVAIELNNGANANGSGNDSGNDSAGNVNQSANAQAGMELSQVFLQMAVTLRPDLTDARLVAAQEDQRAGRFAQARDILAPVAADDALDPQVRLVRAMVLDQLGETDQALALLQGLAKDYPDHAEAFEVMGDIDRERGRSADAVAAYDQALERRGQLGPQDWALLFDRAVASQDSGNWPAAEADLQHALRLAPDQPSLLNYLGYSWADQNRNLPEARELLERAVKLSPGDGAILDSLGWVEFRQGDVKDAVRTLETAVQMDPEDPDVNTHLGDAYEAVGRHLEARYQWQFALSLDPSAVAAARLRAKLASVDTVSLAKAVKP